MRITLAAVRRKAFGVTSAMRLLNDTSPTGEPFRIASNMLGAILSGTLAGRRRDEVGDTIQNARKCVTPSLR